VGLNALKDFPQAAYVEKPEGIKKTEDDAQGEYDFAKLESEAILESITGVKKFGGKTEAPEISAKKDIATAMEKHEVAAEKHLESILREGNAEEKTDSIQREGGTEEKNALAQRKKSREMQSVASEVASQRVSSSVALKYEVGLDSDKEAKMLSDALTKITSTVFVSKLNLALTEAQMKGQLNPKSTELFPVITGVKLDVGLVISTNMTTPPPRKFVGAVSSDAVPMLSAIGWPLVTTFFGLLTLALLRHQ